MKHYKAILILCVLPFLVLLAACGSDSSGSSDRDASLVGDWSRAENDSLWGVKMSSGGDFTFFIVDSSSAGYRYYREVGSWSTEGTSLFIALDRCEMSYTGASWTSSDEDCGNRDASYALEDSILVIYTGDNTLYFVKGRNGILPDSLRSEVEVSSAQETSSSSGAVADFSSSSLVAYSYGEIPDSRDGQVYKTVTIGTQTWMAENLNYADSLATPNLAENSWCYDNSADSCAKYGRLYTWTAAMNIESSFQEMSASAVISVPQQGACPAGWHIPTDAEWTTLEEAAGGSDVAGTALKSTSGWIYNPDKDVYGNGTDVYGFSALPAGYRDASGNFIGSFAFFWSASEDDDVDALSRSLYNDPNMGINSSIKTNANSLRCLKDDF